MKSSINRDPIPKQFQPFTLTIKVETLEEALVLRAFYGANPVSTDVALMEAVGGKTIKKENAHRIVMEALRPLQLELEEQGLSPV